MSRQLFSNAFLLFALTLASNTCFGQFTEVNPREGRLKGKVDSVLFMNFNATKTDTGELKEFSDRCAYLYNEKGLLVEERGSDYEGDEPGPFKTVYKYDDKGHRTEMLDYKRTGVLNGRVFYKFNQATRTVKVRNASTVTGKMLLDKGGNIIEEIIFDKYPAPFSTLRYKYDRKGLCMERSQVWAKSTDSQEITYTYDGRHNLVKEVVINNSKLLASYTYRYDNFDKMGNWLVQRTYRNGKLDGITERTISYSK